MPGLDDLIEFILDKLALKADKGANKVEIAKIAAEFYDTAAASSVSGNDNSRSKFNVDEKFLEKLIVWLSDHKGVRVFHDYPDVGSNEPATGASKTKELRLRATTERAWLAIAGHAPDDTKVRPLEFALLSLIAQHGPSGIPQPDLIRLSGQDKRSLPHRTDILRDRGYIEKKPVSSAGMKTSLCTLLKFVQKTPSVDVEAAINGSENLFNHFVVNGETLLPERFLDISLRVIQEYGLLELTKFREIMGIGANTSGRKWVKAARKFIAHMVSVGCIQQVSVVFEGRKKSVNCLKFVQEPNEEARESICAMTDTLPASILKINRGDLQNKKDNGDLSEDEQGHTTYTSNELVPNDTSRIAHFPSWDPLRPLLNQIFEAIDASGTEGSSGLQLSTRVFSPFWRRALDIILIQLTDLWHVSQPPSLRHLTIVRDSAQKGKVVHYQYYTHKAFSKLVEAGESSWEVIGGDFKKSSEHLDEWGFPCIPTSALVKGNGCSTVSQSYNAARLGRNRGRQAKERGEITEMNSNPADNFSETIAPSPVKDADERKRLGLKPLGRPKKATRRKSKNSQPKPTSQLNIDQPDKSLVQAHGSAHEMALDATSELQEGAENLLQTKPQENSFKGGKYPDKKRGREETEDDGSPSKKPRTSTRTPLDANGNRGHGYSLRRSFVPNPTSAELDLDPSSEVLHSDRVADSEYSNGGQRAVLQPDRSANDPSFAIGTNDPPDSANRGSPLNTKSTKIAATPHPVPPLASRTSVARELVHVEPEKVPSIEQLPSTMSTTRGDKIVAQQMTELQDENPLREGEEYVPEELPIITNGLHDTSSEVAPITPLSRPNNIVNGDTNSTEKVSNPNNDMVNVRKRDQGSVAWKRNKVLLDALDKVGGLCPGPRELQALYTHASASSSKVGQPDLVTVSKVAKSLVASGKLKRFAFTFAHKGAVQQAAIYTLPHYSVDSDAVKKMQSEVIRLHPRKYTPPGIESMVSSRYHTSKKMSGAGLVAVPRSNRQLISRTISAKQALEELPETSLGFARWTDRVNNVSSSRRKRKRDEWDGENTDEDTVPPSMAEFLSCWTLGTIPQDFSSTLPFQARLNPGGDGPCQTTHKRVRFTKHSAGDDDKSSQATSRLDDILYGYHFRLPVLHGGAQVRDSLLMATQDFYPNIGVFSTNFEPARSQYSPKPPTRLMQSLADAAQTHESNICFADTPSNIQVPNQFFAHLDEREAWERSNAHELSLDRQAEDDLKYAEGLYFLIHEIPAEVNSNLRNDQRRSFEQEAIMAPQHGLYVGRTPYSTVGSHSTMRPPYSQPFPRPVNPSWRVTQRSGRVCKWTMCKSDLPLPELLHEPAVLGLLASVITVRTVLGGHKKTIDWPLVVKLVGKKYDHYVLASQWNQIENSHRAEINLLEYSFQKRFLTAYEAKTLPRIRFEDMHIYNWSALKKWAENLISSLTNTDTGYSVSQHLRKRDLGEFYTVRPILVEEQTHDVMFKTQVAITKRTEYMRDTGFCVPMPSIEPALGRTLTVAKSFVRAIISTPDETYDAARARTRLSSVPSHALDAAVAELLKEKHIRHVARGRPTPGRNFGYTDNFMKNLQQHAKHGKNRSIFTKAMEFKRFIDAEFQNTGFYKVTGVADDHHGLVIGSLASQGRLSLEVMTPHVVDDPNYDAPAEELNPTTENSSRKLSIWGMARGSYKTSSLDLSHLVFPVRIYPTEQYVDGLPLPQPLPEPPAPHLEENSNYKSIPIWYDINDDLLPEVWNKVGLSVIRLMHQRPGITAINIAKAMNNVVDTPDVTLIQKWLIKLGMVDGEGMKVKEWWWAVFPGGDDYEDDNVQE